MKVILKRFEAMAAKLRIGRIVAACLAAMVLLFSSTVSAADLSPGLQDKLDEITEKGETGRPRTARQWQEEAEELEGKPLERIKRITEESVDAVGEMAEMYPEALGLDDARDESEASDR